MNWTQSRQNSVTTSLTPFVLLVLVHNLVHGLAIGWNVEETLILGLKFANVIAHHLKLTPLREPRLCYVLNDYFSFDKRILGIDEVDISLEVHHMGMQCAGKKIRDAGTPFAFILRAIVRALHIAGCVCVDADSAVDPEALL